MSLDPFSVGLTLYSLYSASQSEKEAMEQRGMMRREERESLELQQTQLAEQEKWLKEVSSERQQLVTDIYGRDVRSLTDKLNLAGYKIRRSYEENLGRSGFAYSGTLAEKHEKAREEEEMSYLHGRQTLYDQYKSSLITMQQQEQKGLMDIEQQKEMTELRIGQLQPLQREIGKHWGGYAEQWEKSNA